MRAKRTLEAVGCQIRELVLFALLLIALFWLGRDFRGPWWLSLGITAILYFGAGGVPFPRQRRTGHIAIAAFLVPLVTFGWIDWRIEYFLMFEHVGAWQNLPRVLLEPENIATAAALSMCAVLGRRLGAAASGRRRQRTATTG